MFLCLRGILPRTPVGKGEVRYAHSFPPVLLASLVGEDVVRSLRSNDRATPCCSLHISTLRSSECRCVAHWGGGFALTPLSFVSALRTLRSFIVASLLFKTSGSLKASPSESGVRGKAPHWSFAPRALLRRAVFC